MSTVHATIPAQTVRNLALVGQVVTYADEQYTCYSVEGYDYYAFQSATGHDAITCDFDMPAAEWKRQGWAYLLPMGAKIGEGRAIEVPIDSVKRGVNLAKRAEFAGSVAY